MLVPGPGGILELLDIPGAWDIFGVGGILGLGMLEVEGILEDGGMLKLGGILWPGATFIDGVVCMPRLWGVGLILLVPGGS